MNEKAEQDKNLELMAAAPIPKAIIKLGIPTVISSLISVIYNLTDTYFIGLLDDPIQLGAISLAFPVFLVIQAVSTIFSVGAPSYISRCLGSGEYGEVKKTSSVGFYGITVITVILSVLYFIFQNPILRLMGTTAENYAPTKAYMSIIVLFAFTISVQVVLPCVLRAEGKVKESAAALLIGTIVNIVFDPVFILALHMGAAGAAWATILGNVCAAGYCIFVILKKDTFLSLSIKDFAPTKRIVGEIFKIGFPSSITNFVMSFSSILLNNFASIYGNNAVSAVGVANKLMTVMTMTIGGYVMGYLPFVGYNYGAGNNERVKKSFWFTGLSSTVFGLILAVPFTLLGSAFMGAFTSEAQIIELGVECLHIYVFCLPLLGMQYTVTATFQATGKALSAMIANLGRQGIFFIPTIIIFKQIFGFYGLIWAQALADALAVICCILLALPMIKNISKDDLYGK
ncbi:MAG: MATE family efflux transporter [Lachnospiraceae bacterium]|nr:MATE family efflux transporter [Lachnospiraceae bacterium]